MGVPVDLSMVGFTFDAAPVRISVPRRLAGTKMPLPPVEDFIAAAHDTYPVLDLVRARWSSQYGSVDKQLRRAHGVIADLADRLTEAEIDAAIRANLRQALDLFIIRNWQRLIEQADDATVVAYARDTAGLLGGSKRQATAWVDRLMTATYPPRNKVATAAELAAALGSASMAPNEELSRLASRPEAEAARLLRRYYKIRKHG